LPKVHIKNFFQKKRQKKQRQFFSTFFCFIVVRVVLSAGSSKQTTKNVLQKNRAEKFLQENRQKKIRVLSRCWAFLDEGSYKTRGGNRNNPALFILGPLTHPPTTGSPILVCRPLAISFV
jgi:hypothetical protein